jgi:hypothetical protein
MKNIKVLLTVATIGALALTIGCTSTKSRENMLTAAGFRMVPADTAARQAHLNSLPSGKITSANRDGVLYYTYPDKKNNMLYVGTQSQYDQYQKLRLQQQMTEEQENTAAMNDQAWGVWGPWGGPGWAWR